MSIQIHGLRKNGVSYSMPKYSVTVYEVYRITRTVEADDVDQAKDFAETGQGKEVCNVYDGNLTSRTEAEEIS